MQHALGPFLQLVWIRSPEFSCFHSEQKPFPTLCFFPCWQWKCARWAGTVALSRGCPQKARSVPQSQSWEQRAPSRQMQQGAAPPSGMRAAARAEPFLHCKVPFYYMLERDGSSTYQYTFTKIKIVAFREVNLLKIFLHFLKSVSDLLY